MHRLYSVKWIISKCTFNLRDFNSIVDSASFIRADMSSSSYFVTSTDLFSKTRKNFFGVLKTSDCWEALASDRVF